MGTLSWATFVEFIEELMHLRGNYSFLGGELLDIFREQMQFLGEPFGNYWELMETFLGTKGNFWKLVEDFQKPLPNFRERFRKFPGNYFENFRKLLSQFRKPF